MIPKLLQLHTRSALGLPRKSLEIPVLPHSSMQNMERKTPSFFQSCVRPELSVQSSVLLGGFRTEQGEFPCSSWKKLWSLSQNLLQTSTGQVFDLGSVGLE